MPCRTTRRGGFTAIELMIVMTVVIALTGLVLAAGAQVRSSQRNYATQRTMRDLATSLDHLLGRNALIQADNANGDLYAPLDHVYHDLPAMQRTLQLTTSLVLTDTSGELAGPWRATGIEGSTHLADAWGEPILVRVLNSDMPGLTGRQHTSTVILRSANGGTWDADDVVLALDAKTGIWQQARITGARTDPWVLTIR